MSAGAREQATRAQGVDADMEQILSSIRRIIAEDQAAMGMPLPEPRARKASRQPSGQGVAPAAQRVEVRDGAGLNGATAPVRPADAPVRAPAPAGPRLDPAPLPQPGHAAVAATSPDDEVEQRRASLDDSLHRLAAERSESADSGLPPRRLQPRAQPPRAPVQLAPAPDVDYRPPEVRARDEAAATREDDVFVDQRLADAIRRAVSERIDEVAQAAIAAAQPAAQAAPATNVASWETSANLSSPSLDQAAHATSAHDPYQPAPYPLPELSAPGTTTMVGLAVARQGAAPPAALAYARDQSVSLVAPVSAARISSAFDALTQRVAAERARTMEETVSDMLRPMLASWLDQHLPDIVERLVAEQIALLAQRPQD